VAAAGLAALVVARPARGQARDASLGFLGDGGTGDTNQQLVRDALLRHPPRLVFILGDNIYTDGRPSRFKARFDDMYRPVVQRGARFHAALGNHDLVYCRVAPFAPLPPNKEAYRWRDDRCYVDDHLEHEPFGYASRRRYYSVPTDGSATPLGEVFVLDSNTLGIGETKLAPTGDDRAQLDWLDRTLSLSRARWKIVVMHHPPHTPVARKGILGFGDGRLRETRLDNQLAPILKRRSVDAVFAGHNHFYARMFPQDGIRYFVTGGGGRRIYGFQPAPGYVAAGGVYLHYVHVRLSDERFEYWAIDWRGRSRDGGWFAKGDARDRLYPPDRLPPG
jgi:3',5'-cyclic AMP phosphodiesterase CpdA